MSSCFHVRAGYDLGALGHVLGRMMQDGFEALLAQTGGVAGVGAV